MTSVLILLSAFDPGTYYIEDNGDPTDGIAQLRGPDGSVIPFNIPTEYMTVTASAGRSVVINLPEWDAAADINVGNLTNSAENPDSITVARIGGAADVTLVSNGAITELGSDAAADIVADSVILSAATGVGTSSNAIETQVGTLEAETTTGGINIGNFGTLAIGGLTADVAGLDVETSGNIVLTNLGSIFLNDDSGLETIHGGGTSGDVTLVANGANSDIISIIDHDAIAAQGGSVTLTAGRDVSLGTQGANYDNDIRARDNLTINAGRDVSVDGFSDLASDGYGAGTGGDVVVNAGRDINVLNSTGTDGSIGAEGNAGGDLILNAGPGGFVRLLASSTATLFSNSGDVTVNSDRLVIAPTAGISANTGTVTLRPETEGWEIDLGSATDGAFALEISDAEVDRIFTSNLTIGSLASGPVTASAAFGPASVQNLHLISGTDILLASAMTVAGKLTLRAGDNVQLTSGSATTAGELDILVDQVEDDLSTGGQNFFGGAVTAGILTVSGRTDADTLRGAEGIDQIVHGNGGNDTIYSSGEGQYFGDSGKDTIFAGLSSGLVDEILDGGVGNDTVDTSSFTGGYTINLATGVTNFGYERFFNFENVITGAGNDTITGTSGANIIETGLGDDTLNGAGGVDTLIGGGGDDRYYVDHVADVVVEEAGGGSDRVLASVSYTLGAGVHVELLMTSKNGGTAAINLTGNELVNSIYGNAGNNILNGGGGADKMTGLGGNDRFYVDNAGDVVVEKAGGGNDRVVAGTSYTLGAGVHVELLTTNNNAGVSAINLNGNGLNQTILGNAGDNVLDGRGGTDTLQGFGGSDTFRFTKALGANNIDTIVDYSVADDVIHIDNAVFTGLANGALAAGAFRVGAAAADAGDRIIYNSATGALLFDADGSGAGAAVQFATLSTGLAMTAGEFFVI